MMICNDSIASEDAGGEPSDASFVRTLERMSPSKGNAPISQSIEFIQSALQRIGISKKIDLESADSSSVRDVCDTIYTLLLHIEQSEEYKGNLQREVQESRHLINLERKQTQRLKDELDLKEKQLRNSENKANMKDETIKEELSRYKALTADLRKRVRGGESKLNHMAHALDKKEKEYNRLQDRMSAYLADKKEKNQKVTEIAGKLGRVPSGARTLSPRQVRQDDGLQGIITCYENKQIEYVKQIKELKSSLASMEALYAEAMNNLEKRQVAAVDSSTTIDSDFINAIPQMSAAQLSSEVSSRIKALQRRIHSLDWHAQRMESTSGPLSVREQQLVSDLDAARSVLHDQEFLLKNVLTSMRTSIIHEKENMEARLRDKAKMFEGTLESSQRKFVQDREILEKETDTQLACLRQEYEQKISEQSNTIKDLEAKVERLESHIEVLHNKHKEILDGEIQKAKDQFEAEVEQIRSGAEATMASMAAESSKVQLDYKRTHSTLRAEANALRERLIVEKELREDLERKSLMEAEVVSEEATKALKEEFESFKLEKNEEISRLEASYTTKIDTLLKEKQDSEANAEAIQMDLVMTKEKLQDAREELERHSKHAKELEEKIIELKKSTSEDTQREIANTLQKAEKQHLVERQELMDKLEEAEERVRAAQADVFEKEEIVKKVQLKEAEAKLAISRYGELTDHYKGLMSKYAPGLGAGAFLEQAIQRKATAMAR